SRRRAAPTYEPRPTARASDRVCGRAVHERSDGVWPIGWDLEEVSAVHRSVPGILREKRNRVHHSIRHRSGPYLPRVLDRFLHHTGLRTSDIVRFSPDRLNGNSALVRMAKTGNPVWLPLPEFLVAKLKTLPLYEGKYYFSSGDAKLSTATGNARRSLRKLSKLARLRTVNPHRFRDTLAINLLQENVPIEDVKEILG